MANEKFITDDQDRIIFNKKITRRKFLKGSAAAAAITGAALATSGAGGTVLKALAKDDGRAAKAATEEKIYGHTCRGNCMNTCYLNVHVRDGKIVRTSMRELPDPENNRACLKGLTHTHQVYREGRLRYPMKRAGERGEGKWEQITWDEAISTVCAKWKELHQKYGPSSIASWSLTGTYGSVNGSGGAGGRLRHLLGMTYVATAIDLNLIYGSMYCLGVGSNWTANAHTDMVNAKTIIVWGANPTESQMQTWHFVADAIQHNGAKLICIDPTYNTTAAKSHMWVPIRPGTDGFLANAMSKYLIDSDLADLAFLKKSTVAPFLLKEDGLYLRLSDTRPLAEGETDTFMVLDAKGEVRPVAEVEDPSLHGSVQQDGIKASTVYDQLIERFSEYTLERAEEICQIPVATIKEVAEIYAKNGPATLYQGFGIDRWLNGFAAHFSIITLAMIAGQLGKPGASAGYIMYPGYEWLNNAFATMIPNRLEPAGPTINVMLLPDAVASGKWEGKDLPIKSLYIHNNNPLNSIGNRNKTLHDVFDNMEMIVVVDNHMSDTARYADIILPTTSWFETWDIYGTICVQPYTELCEKAIEPLYESKSDFHISKLLAEGMGFPEAFGDMTELDYLKGVILPPDQQPAPRKTVRGKTLTPVTFERLVKEGGAVAFTDPFGIHGAGGVFPTATGRAQMYLESLSGAVPFTQYQGEGDLSVNKWPHFEPPYEAWPVSVGGYEKNPLADKYPLAYYQEHTRWRVHSTWSHTTILRELDPEPVVKISHADAAARNIRTGDIVKVFNDRGYCVVKAVITGAQRPGQVNIPKGWHDDQFIEGHYQDLTNNTLNPVLANLGYFDVLVEVELYKKES
jgi:molybdopterin-containing oxidoreductase family molybdopterin binding subunit